MRHEFTPDEIEDLQDQGLAWDFLFELGTSSAPFTHAVRLIAPYDLQGRYAIVQPTLVGCISSAWGPFGRLSPRAFPHASRR